MDFKQLRSFLHVMETGSLSLAAKRLNVTQPALSRQIKMLEEDVGSPLFIRTGRGVTLSEAGEQFAPRARIIAEEMERLKLDMRDLSATIQGEVRLGLPPSVGLMIAGPVVETFHRRYPHVQLRITQLLSGALQENILDGRLDLGVLFDGSVSPLLRSEHLWSEKLYFITQPGSHLAKRETITLAEALDEPMVLPGAKHGLHKIITREADHLGKKLNVVIEAESLAIHTELLCRGLGCSILTYGGCQSLIEEGRLVAIPLINPEVERNPVLVWSKDFPLTRAAQAMADVIKEISKDIKPT